MVLSCHTIESCYKCYITAWQKAGDVLVRPWCDGICNACNVLLCCSTRIGGLGQLQQIWMTAKLQNFKCQSSQRKIRNIQSESVSKTAGCFTTRSNCSFHTAALIRTSEILEFHLIFLFAAVYKIYKRGYTLSHFFQLMWESERSTQKWIMQRQDSAEQGKDQKMCSKSEKRISVTFSDCFSIPDAPGSKSSLSKKYIFPLSLCICTWWHWTIFLSRSQEELLEQLTVSLGHVECRHAHYPATPPVYRSEEDH